MHVTVSASTLVILLIVVIAIALLLRVAQTRRRKHPTKRTGKRPGRANHGRAPFARARSGGRDRGARVAQKYGLDRSPEWPGVAREHLLREPACVVCGHTGQGLQVHHIKPFHLHPNLELDPRNLITLCEIRGREHHLLIGHLDDWESYNVNVRADSKRFHNESARKIRANPTWQREVLRRPLP